MEHHDLFAPRWVSSDQEPKELASEILPRLYMGGTHDDDTIDIAGELPQDLGNHEFDAVATMYAWARPMGWGVEEVRLGIYDRSIEDSSVDRIMRTAVWAYERWASGDRVLIRCQAGLNRSGLITALVLMLAGHEAIDAIRLIRERRAEVALFNDDFARWLVDEAPAFVEALARPSASPSAA